MADVVMKIRLLKPEIHMCYRYFSSDALTAPHMHDMKCKIRFEAP